MRARSLVLSLVGTLLGVAVGAAGGVAALVNGWLPIPFAAAKPDAGHDNHAHANAEFIQISEQAKANLGLDLKPVKLEPFERQLTVPARVVDRPGQGEVVVTAPAAGVVEAINAVPGDLVAPGASLFQLRLLGEEMLDNQKELFKAARDLQVTQDERKRIDESVRSGALPPTRLLELDYQIRRSTAALEAARQELAARGLDEKQIKEVSEGKFLTRLTVFTPAPSASKSVASETGHIIDDVRLDYSALKVQAGEKVDAGQALAVLTNHNLLDIEAHGFRHEANLIHRAAAEVWAVEAEFPDEKQNPWKVNGEAIAPTVEGLRIRYLGNELEGENQAFRFFLSLTNQARVYERDGKSYRVWRFRPGQRVLVNVPVEKWKDVIVVPAAAVVREAAEVYVFRQNGDGFERRPVRVLYEDRERVVLAHDGSVNVGDLVAQSGAAALNRALKAKAGGGEEGHHHHHHDH